MQMCFSKTLSKPYEIKVTYGLCTAAGGQSAASDDCTHDHCIQVQLATIIIVVSCAQSASNRTITTSKQAGFALQMMMDGCWLAVVCMYCAYMYILAYVPAAG